MERILQEAFKPMIEDGTIDVEEQIVVNGGNWALLLQNGIATLVLPIGDKRYEDSDPEVFLDNVLCLEVEENLMLANQMAGGKIVAALKASQGDYAVRLAARIERLQGK